MDASNCNPEARVLAKAESEGISLRKAKGALIEDSRKSFREQRHDLTTNKGVVAFINEAINAFVVDPDGTIVGRNELNTLGYVCGVQLRAIQAVQEEENPSDSLNDLLGGGQMHVEIRMTREERKMFLTAGSPDNMARVLEGVKKDGRILDLQEQTDGSFSVPATLSEPPRTDAPMPVKLITDALNAEGANVTQRHVREVLGPSLGGEPTAGADAIEEFGYQELFHQTPAEVPLIAHNWETVSKDHPVLPGAVIRVSQCTKCGITTRNTEKHKQEVCGTDKQ